MLLLPCVVPGFNGDGYLPDGIYPCGEEGLFFHFVELYPESLTRQGIFDGFARWRTDAQSLIETITLWVDGSFVTDKLNPHDVDVVSFCDTDYYNALDKAAQEAIDSLLDGLEATLLDYSVHSFLELSAPPGHPEYHDFEILRSHDRKWFAKTYVENPFSGDRIETPQLKGFLEMTLGEQSAAPRISKERI